jgi:hypothetical protein
VEKTTNPTDGDFGQVEQLTVRTRLWVHCVAAYSVPGVFYAAYTIMSKLWGGVAADREALSLIRGTVGMSK